MGSSRTKKAVRKTIKSINSAFLNGSDTNTNFKMKNNQNSLKLQQIMSTKLERLVIYRLLCQVIFCRNTEAMGTDTQANTCG